MKTLYVTTDGIEAEQLIEGNVEKPRYDYHDIKANHGTDIAKRIGFNPMCSVELSDSVKAKELEGIVARLVKAGKYVAIEFNGQVQQYLPKDAKEREELIKLYLRKKEMVRTEPGPDYYLFHYSNNPNQIREINL